MKSCSLKAPSPKPSYLPLNIFKLRMQSIMKRNFVPISPLEMAYRVLNESDIFPWSAFNVDDVLIPASMAGKNQKGPPGTTNIPSHLELNNYQMALCAKSSRWIDVGSNTHGMKVQHIYIPERVYSSAHASSSFSSYTPTSLSAPQLPVH